jgi:hypothetical protein
MTSAICFADFKDLAKFCALNPLQDKSARLLRNKMGHDLGPTSVGTSQTARRFSEDDYIPNGTACRSAHRNARQGLLCRLWFSA